MSKFIFHIVSNAVALYVATFVIEGFVFSGVWWELLLAALALTLMNMILRPIFKLVLGPVILLTFGLGVILVNALTLYLLDFLFESLTIQGYVPLMLGTLIIGVVNGVLHFLFQRSNK